MGHPSTLYRFRLDLSDVDRGVYESLDFRVAMHPSETPLYLLTRVLAFALSVQEGLEFSPGGLSDPDEPCLRVPGIHGGVTLWIEVGNPSARKLHKAAKASTSVKVYTYKDPTPMLREISAGDIYQAHRIEIYSFAPAFLERLATRLERDNKWSIVHTDGALTINIGDQTEQGELTRHYLQS